MMWTSVVHEQMVLFLALFVLPELALCGCVLGGSNSQDLIKRNQTILDTMNNTLMNYTKHCDEKIITFSDFQLWTHIQTTLNVTADNYLVHGASMGRLLTIDWLRATQGIKTNLTDNRTLEAYIRGEFLNPLHNKLQEMAVYYSFSLGIFRSQTIQFNFTGIDLEIQPPKSPLDLTCMAGSRFLWRLSTSRSYEPIFGDRRSRYFARFATMVENSFDEYYRNHGTLGKDFARVNLFSIFENLGQLIVFLEAYFVNRSFTDNYITSLFDPNKVPPMYFSNGTLKATLITLKVDYPYTYIVNATVAAIQTTTVSSTVSTATSSTSIATTFSAVNASGYTTTVSPILTTLIKSESVPAMPTYSTINPFSNTSTLNVTTFPHVTNTSVWTLTAANTSISSDIANTSTILQTNYAFSTIIPTIFEALNLANATTPEPSTGSSGGFNVSNTTFNDSGQGANTTTFGDLLNTSCKNGSLYCNQSITDHGNGTGFGEANITSYANGTGYGNQSIAGYGNGTVYGNQSFTGSGNGTGFGNGSIAGFGNGTHFGNQSAASYGNGTGSGNHSTTGFAGGNGTRTTFDPDPYFLASVPVLKKVYNDDVLLWKLSPMLPITAKTAFYTITIPVAVGIILVVILCLVCFQVECCPGRHKTDQSNDESKLLPN